MKECLDCGGIGKTRDWVVINTDRPRKTAKTCPTCKGKGVVKDDQKFLTGDR